MIVLDLRCPDGHRFEGWFASTESFETQNRGNLVCCPYCSQAGVVRMPSAVAVISSSERKVEATPSLPENLAQVEQHVAHVLRNLAEQCENVGNQFVEEARRIHYKEAPSRGIRGVASAAETRELLEEGISVLPVPGNLDGETH